MQLFMDKGNLIFVIQHLVYIAYSTRRILRDFHLADLIIKYCIITVDIFSSYQLLYISCKIGNVF